MNLAIITVPRDGANFVYQSLLSLFASASPPGRVDVFLGSEDDGYLEFLGSSPGVVLHRLGPDEARLISGWTLHRRHSHNYWRALDHFAGMGEDLCLCEDDVLYDPEFWPKLLETVAEMEAITPDYVLALYSEMDYGGNPSLLRGRLISAYPADSFFGTQGMYYPSAVIRDYADDLRRRGVGLEEKPTDLLIGDLCNARQNVYLARNSLVQHIGRVSTGIGYYHRSPSFGRPWPAADDAPRARARA